MLRPFPFVLARDTVDMLSLTFDNTLGRNSVSTFSKTQKVANVLHFQYRGSKMLAHFIFLAALFKIWRLVSISGAEELVAFCKILL